MRKKQQGFTLVEMMIALGVTAVILLAAVLAFRESVLVNSNVTQASDINDNLRAGMNLMVQDLIQAGTGIPTGGISIPNTQDATGCNTSLPVNRPGPPPAAITFQGPNSLTPGCNVILPAVEPGPALGPAIVSTDGTTAPISDMVTMLYADNTLALNQSPIIRPASIAPPIAACNGALAADGSTVTFDPAPTCVTLGAAGIPVSPGDLILFSNANGNALQCVTAVAGQVLTFSAGDPFALNGRTASVVGGTLKQLQAPPGSGTYPPTTATRIWMISYFLDSNATDPAHPRLMRQVNFNQPQPVAESIESLQFRFNLADGTIPGPSNFAAIPGGDNENELRAVTISLGARGAQHTVGNARFTRSNLSTQVALRSLAYFNNYR
jgi:prepilin-type N-terminal cleavage/methylation domain-containing protein